LANGCFRTVLFPDPNGLSVLEAIPLPTVANTTVKKWAAGLYPEWCWDMVRHPALSDFLEELTNLTPRQALSAQDKPLLLVHPQTSKSTM
jgi:hypothetical protein